MDATDREMMIERLQREADDGRARIAERQAAREADPNSELERLMADQRFTHERGDLIYTEPPDEPSPPIYLSPVRRQRISGRPWPWRDAF